MEKIIEPLIVIPLYHYEELKILINSKLENHLINTKLKLPPEDEDVLLLYEHRWPDGFFITYQVGRLKCLRNGKKYFTSNHKLKVEDVKYWMYLPPYPIE